MICHFRIYDVNINNVSNEFSIVNANNVLPNIKQKLTITDLNNLVSGLELDKNTKESIYNSVNKIDNKINNKINKCEKILESYDITNIIAK